jgi:putative hydrolase of the HAD superfamily
MKQVAAVCLDLDDTLWEIAPVIERAESVFYAWLGETYPDVTALFAPGDIRELRGSIAEEYPDRAHDLGWLRRRTYQRMAEAADCSDTMVTTAFAVFQAARNQVSLFEDVVPVLEVLSRQRALFALTNGNACLSTIGLSGFFEHIFTAAELGAAKPDPHVFREVCRRSGLPAQDIVHVGNDPHRDVVAPLGIGMRAVWVNRGAAVWPDAAGPPAPEVRDLYGLLDLLDA